MDRVLSVDLASTSKDAVGFCLFEKGTCGQWVTRFPKADDLGIKTLDSEFVASALFRFCGEEEVRILLLDGPQGWKDPSSELDYRACEKELNTQGKTGVPHHVKPANWTRFVEFSIAVFGNLRQSGAKLLEDTSIAPSKTQLLVLETYPASAWKSLCLLPLPKKYSPADLCDRIWLLAGIFPIRLVGNPNSHELQALVSGLVGTAAIENNHKNYSVRGRRPFESQGTVFEGFIVNPTLPTH